MEKIRIAKIINTHGIKGDLKLESYTDFPDERFKKGHHLYIVYNNKEIEVVVYRHRVHKGFDLVSFEDYLDINKVECFKESYIYDYKDYDLLDDDEYYVSDLIGCKVYDKGSYIGKITEVDLYDHHDVLIVEGERIIKIPYVDAFVKKEDIEHKHIDVDLIEGF